MTSATTSTTAANEARFFVALIPPAEVQDYANRVIQELSDRYHTCTAPSPPHITLQAPFLWQMTDLAHLENCLSQFAQNQSAVSIRLSGFGNFAPHVLYINVLKTPELLALQARLVTHHETQGIINSRVDSRVDSIAQHRSFSPHLTVASRKLTATAFEQAWSELQLRQVEFEWVSDRLTLLLHDGQRWQIRSQFLMSGREN